MLATIYNLLHGKSIGIPAIQADLYPKKVGQVRDSQQEISAAGC
ncbi:hypothetical protein [Terribacillus saccharophilus]|nr:hypothetical protein [Terribacillus saccharophilus]